MRLEKGGERRLPREFLLDIAEALLHDSHIPGERQSASVEGAAEDKLMNLAHALLSSEEAIRILEA
jgi:hypothetical protein